MSPQTKSKGKPLLLVVISFLSVLPWHTLASGGGKPLVTAITKDSATKLYTIAVKDGHPLALDLSGELVWSTCDASHSTILPYERECVEIILSSSLWGPHKARRRGGGGGRAGSSHGPMVGPSTSVSATPISSSTGSSGPPRAPICVATASQLSSSSSCVTEEEEETTKPAVASLKLGDV
uniref:Bulb-type lectin domain-containing protein n=1 Tax=Oryza glumipatula TaxID=40148 RepID=A0A0D9YS82_9ORYZ